MDPHKEKYLNKIIKYGYKYYSNKCDKYLNKLLFHINEYDQLVLHGGQKKTLFFIATHDNRLQCLLSRLFSITNPHYNNLTKRLQNCAILKISIIENALKIEMIYEGETTENKQNFWTRTEFYKIHQTPRPLSDDRYSFLKIKDDTVLFFIRHGKGIHNMNMTTRKIMGATDLVKKHIVGNYDKKHPLVDAELDETGIIQAKNAGDSLLKYLNENMTGWQNQKLLFGCSKLYRTRQTIGTIMSRLFPNVSTMDYQINVIPCSHEVATVEKTGKCIDTGFKNELAYENKAVCNNKSDDNEKCKNIIIPLGDKKKLEIFVNWSEYINHQYDCINDTIINIAYEIANK